MKKIFVLLIAMIIASLSISTAYASRGSGTITSNGRVITEPENKDGESDFVNTPNLNKIDWSAQKWYGSKETRAYLVMGMFVECLESLPASALSVLLEAQATDSMYVANAAENEVDVYCFGENACFVFRYIPKYGFGTYEVYKHENANMQGENYMKQMKKEKKCTSYSRVKQDEVDALLDN